MSTRGRSKNTAPICMASLWKKKSVNDRHLWTQKFSFLELYSFKYFYHNLCCLEVDRKNSKKKSWGFFRFHFMSLFERLQIMHRSRMMVTPSPTRINAFLRHSIIKYKTVKKVTSCTYQIFIWKCFKFRQCDPDLSSSAQVKSSYFPFLQCMSCWVLAIVNAQSVDWSLITHRQLLMNWCHWSLISYVLHVITWLPWQCQSLWTLIWHIEKLCKGWTNSHRKFQHDNENPLFKISFGGGGGILPPPCASEGEKSSSSTYMYKYLFIF